MTLSTATLESWSLKVGGWELGIPYGSTLCVGGTGTHSPHPSWPRPA